MKVLVIQIAKYNVATKWMPYKQFKATKKKNMCKVSKCKNLMQMVTSSGSAVKGGLVGSL